MVARIIQDPIVEGALVSQDIETDYVVAMVGGYDFDRSQFNQSLSGLSPAWLIIQTNYLFCWS